MSRLDVVVVGGGPNGLTCAALLARAGRSVCLLERREVLGGLAVGEEFACGLRAPGPLHDASSVRPEVIEELKLETHGLALAGAPPPVYAPQREGGGLLLLRDPVRAASEIGVHSAHDAERYAQLEDFLERIRAVIEEFWRRELPRARAGGRRWSAPLMLRVLRARLLGREDLCELLRSATMSAADGLSEWFESELLRALLAGEAVLGTFLGPRSPGSYANLLLARAPRARAARDGPVALVRALESAARAHGVTIRTGAEVVRIRISLGRVRGVELAGGEELEAPAVVGACDPKTVLLRLVDPKALGAKLEERIAAFRARGTSAKVDLLLREPLRFAGREDLAIERARTGESLEELERSFDRAKYGLFPERPLLDIYAPTDGAWEGRGGHVVSVLAHAVPYRLKDGWTEEAREALGEAVVGELARYAPGVRETIVEQRVFSPRDIEDCFGTTEGHIHHGEHGLDQRLVRPSPECAHHATPIEGLFLASGGTHPGGGLTCAPGRLAAGAVERAARRGGRGRLL